MIEAVTRDIALRVKECVVSNEKKLSEKILFYIENGIFLKAMEPQWYCCASAEKLREKGEKFYTRNKIGRSIELLLKCRQYLMQSGFSEDIKPTIEMFYQLGKLYLKYGFPKFAEEHFLKGDTIRRGVDPENHEIRANLKSGLAESNRLLKNYEIALNYCQNAIESLKFFYGNENIFVAEELHNKAIIYNEKNDYENAKAAFLMSLSMKENIEGSESMCTVRTSIALATLYYSHFSDTDRLVLIQAERYCLISSKIIKGKLRNTSLIDDTSFELLKNSLCMLSMIYDKMGENRKADFTNKKIYRLNEDYSNQKATIDENFELNPIQVFRDSSFSSGRRSEIHNWIKSSF